MSEPNKLPSQAIEAVRDALVGARGDLNNVDAPGASGLKDVSGLLTCAIRVLYDLRKEQIKHEVAAEDHIRGKSVPFKVRGTGLDLCPCCFVCGVKRREEVGVNDYLHNLAAFVKTKEDGQIIVDWAAKRAFLDFQPSDPDWLQVKIGSCTKHLPNLQWLSNKCRVHGVIRQSDIVDAMMHE